MQYFGIVKMYRKFSAETLYKKKQFGFVEIEIITQGKVDEFSLKNLHNI